MEQSGWRLVTNNVLHRPTVGLVLSRAFVSDLTNGTEYILSKFEDDTKLGRVADTPKATIQTPQQAGHEVPVSPLKFNKKCKAHHLEKKTSQSVPH